VRKEREVWGGNESFLSTANYSSQVRSSKKRKEISDTGEGWKKRREKGLILKSGRLMSVRKKGLWSR